MKTIAIMQPTFLPWIGYFAMIEIVDTFVFLDSVQFAKRSWQQRNRIKTPKGEHMLTVPVMSKGLSDQLIKDVCINRDEKFDHKFLNTITANYAKSPYYKEYFPEIKSIVERNTNNLCQLNIELITWLMRCLGITTKVLSSSELALDGKKADLLSEICVSLGATNYLSAPGSKAYIDESDAFVSRGIQVSYHHYEHPVYPQLWGEFIPYLCTLDLLFNCGPGSREIVLSGIKDTAQ